MTSRRTFIKGAAGAGALAAFGFGYSHTAHQMLKGMWAGQKPSDPISGNAPEPEFRVDPNTGEITPNPHQAVSYTVCMGCTTLCGVRVRVDKPTQTVLRVTGNPYHILSSDPFLPYDTPVRESFQAVSRFKERGLAERSTACGRGNAVLQKLDSPHRVLTPLKRVGPRGSGLWAPISFERLVEEVVEGGNLFGEGPVEGLRAIRDLDTPIDPQQPELGPKANQLAVLPPFDDGRLAFAQRFARDSFGTKNIAGHRSYCGLSMRMGYAALLGDLKKSPHLKPDFANAEFLLFIGTAPGNAGNPFKRQGYLIAKARSEGKLKYVVVDPVLTNGDSLAADGRSRWIPIKPATDGALAMAMIRWILENNRFDARYLAQPNPKAAEAAGEPSWSNATHFVVVEKGDPRFGRFLRADDLGLGRSEEEKPLYVAFESASGKPVRHDRCGPAELFYEGEVTTSDGRTLAVKTGLALLREEAMRHELAAYSEACGIPVATIVELAREFTSHGKRAAVDCHGGTMASNGFYAAYAIVMLNALIGNLNWKGGTSAGGGKFKAVAPGPRYNLTQFPGLVKGKGVMLSRNGFKYEKTTEYRRKVEAGQNPYPSKAPWYPISPGLSSEFLSSALNGYPYRLKALILWSSNQVYGVAGLHEQIQQKLADPKELPLIVSVDPFINESNAFADYIVPDSVLYESWGWSSAWGGHLTQVSSARWPVVAPRQMKNAEGRSIDMETFFIAVAKRLGLPGFGEGAIPDAEGNLHPLHRPEDYYLRAAANVAFDGKQPVADASDDDIALSGVDRLVADLRATLKPQEWRKVAAVYARGGRFENADRAYQGEWLSHRYGKPLQIFNEELAAAKNTLTGRRYLGTPTWVPPVLADGSPLDKAFPPQHWPFRLVSTKSQLQSPHTIGTVKLQQIQPSNPVALHPDDARALGLKSGDRVRVSTPGGSGEAVVQVRPGIQRGVLGIEHGFGHRELGARSHRFGDRLAPASALAGKGININDLGLADPAREGISVLSDWVCGNVARQGLPARIEAV